MVIKKTTKQQAKKFVTDFVNYLQQKKKLPVNAVYLFGSYTRDRQREWSDIDVAVISDKFKGEIDPYEYLWLNLRDIDIQRGIEPVGYHPLNFVEENPLVEEIKLHGIRII